MHEDEFEADARAIWWARSTVSLAVSSVATIRYASAPRAAESSMSASWNAVALVLASPATTCAVEPVDESESAMP